MVDRIIIGTQYGDEGKGKIVDVLAKEADYVIRYQGGNNAGHTIQVGDTVYKLHLVPSGVFYGKDVVIGNGVVIDPDVLLKEIEQLKQQGIALKLHISERAHLILPYNIQLDIVKDEAQGKFSAGSTKRGIAPAYGDKALRDGFRVCDLYSTTFKERLLKTIEQKQLLFEHVYRSMEKINTEEIIRKVEKWKTALFPYVEDTSALLHQALQQNKSLLFEGAQATFLDVDLGIYPYSTSSNPTVGGAFTGSGVFCRNPEIIGIAKAYVTRVGNSPFVTELKDKTGDDLREKGGEYGTTTGRPRRCGWLDLVMLQYARRVNDLSAIALTKLDILSGIETLKICVAYKTPSEITKSIPADFTKAEEYQPIYVELPGWQEDITHAKEFNDLPINAKAYIQFIELELGIPISYIGVGKERTQLIVR